MQNAQAIILATKAPAHPTNTCMIIKAQFMDEKQIHFRMPPNKTQPSLRGIAVDESSEKASTINRRHWKQVAGTHL